MTRVQSSNSNEHLSSTSDRIKLSDNIYGQITIIFMFLRNTTQRKRSIGFSLAVVMLFNIASSVVLSSNAGERKFAMLCTSQGLVKVALDSDAADIPDTSNTNHCSFCKLFDYSLDTTNTELGYPQPQPQTALLYKTPLALINERLDLSSRPLRAPPLASHAY